jgi:hypothetical protein
MIELPARPAPNAVNASLIDFGFQLKPATGAAVTRIDRPGSRYAVEVTFPVMKSDVARVFVSRLQKAVSEGLRIDYPLLGVSQGNPGAPVVDGANPTGTTLPVRGLTPGYQVKEGYWLTLIDADGVLYLHNVTANVRADGDGEATLSIYPMIRAPLADGSTILLGKPQVEGLIEDIKWTLMLGDFVQLGFVLEEAA